MSDITQYKKTDQKKKVNIPFNHNQLDLLSKKTNDFERKKTLQAKKEKEMEMKKIEEVRKHLKIQNEKRRGENRKFMQNIETFNFDDDL